jgi:WD40 repeat protein
LGRAELHDDPLTAELTKKLADARLITTTENGLEVAHEALIREWPRLREWLDAGRKGLLIHRRLTIAASEWQERAKDTSLLYRGIRLAEAEDWKKNVNQQLNEQECQFLLASIEEREQEEIKTEEYRRKTAELQSQKQVGQVLKAATIVVVFFFLTAVFFAFEASNKADEAQQLKNVLLAKDMISAMQAEPLPDGEVALKLAIASLGLNAQVDTQGSLYEAFFSPHRITLNGEVNPRASFSPNGDLIMAFSPLGAVRVWRTDGTEVIRLFGKHTSINSASFSPAGDLILTTSLDDGNALVRKLDGTVLGSVGHKDGVHSASFNPTGDLILTTGGDGTAKVWELDGTLQTTLTGHTGWWVSSAAFNSAGDKIVTAGDDSTAKVWTIDGVELATLTGHTNRVSTAIFSPAGDLIVTTSADGTAKLWELDGTEVATLATPTDWVRSAAFNPAGNLIVTASDDSTAKVWGIDGTLLATLTGHTNQVSVASFNHAGDMIVTASDDGTAKVWNIDGTLLTTLKRHTGTVLSAAFDPTDGMIVTASADGTVMVWELHDNGQVTLPRMNLAEDLTMITAIVGPTLRDPLATFSPGGDKVVIAINGEISFYGEGQLLTKSINNEALVWGVNGNLLTKLTGHKEAILSAAFHPAGNMIVTASSDKPVKVWGVDGTLLTTLRGHRDVVLLATFNPEGNMIITASKDGTVKFWAVDGTLLGTRGILEDQLSATLSPKGNLMITVDQNHTARVWGINDNDQTAQMWQIDDVLQAEFSPANNMIITVNNDGTAKVWGIDGKELAVLTGSDQIESATFNPSGNLIVTTGGAIRVWGVDGTLQVALPVEGSSAIFSPTSDLILTVSDDIARIWGIDGTPRSVLSGHLANLAIFSPSGDLIITVDNEGGARLWPTIPSIVEEAYLRINRGFSETECLQYFRDDLDACPRTKEELFAPLAHYITNP